MLKNEFVQIIERRKNEILKELNYSEEVIRDDIFKLLRQKSKIIFYPLEEELDLDGFHIEKSVNGQMVAFVYINTAKNYEKCIFCGAHELGHIYEIEKDILNEYPQEVLTMQDIDDVMNRFAAELLMPRENFKQKFEEFLMRNRKNNSVIKYSELLKTIVALMDYYYVPYKAVVWRLWEIDFLTLSGRDKFENIEKEERDIIDAFILEGKYTRLRHPTRLKNFENLTENLKYAEENGVYGANKIQMMKTDFDIDISIPEDKIAQTESDELDIEDFVGEYQ